MIRCRTTGTQEYKQVRHSASSSSSPNPTFGRQPNNDKAQEQQEHTQVREGGSAFIGCIYEAGRFCYVSVAKS